MIYMNNSILNTIIIFFSFSLQDDKKILRIMSSVGVVDVSLTQIYDPPGTWL